MLRILKIEHLINLEMKVFPGQSQLNRKLADTDTYWPNRGVQKLVPV